MRYDGSFGIFSLIFKENIVRRSRTANGVGDVSGSLKKQKPQQEGRDLIQQVERNTENLIRFTWDNAGITIPKPLEIKTVFENCYDIINENLQDQNVYQEERRKLVVLAKNLRQETGLFCLVNCRYRTWRLNYVSLGLTPLEIDQAMDFLYKNLAIKMVMLKSGSLSLAGFLAWTDYMIDKAIHPWIDGCGRHATAMVMWFSLLAQRQGWNYRLPIFGARDEHYKTIQNFASHINYFEKCLKKEL